MALRKEFTLSNGVTGDYWRLRVNVRGFRCYWALDLYLSEVAAQNGAEPLDKVICFDEEVTREQRAGNLFALGYERIVAQEFAELEGAEEV